MAERKEDSIYTHYEGWLPEDDKLRTTMWQDAWCDLVRDTRPTVCLRTPAPTDVPSTHPTYDTTNPTTATRINARTQQISY